MEGSNDGPRKDKKNDRSKKKMSAPNLLGQEVKSSGKGGRPKVEARISVEELRAKFKKQMSLPGYKNTSDDAPLFDPMEKCRESLMKSRGETAVVFDMQMAEPHCLWDPQYPECPERYFSVVNRCQELGLLERCLRIPARQASREEILSQHSELIYGFIKSTDSETDVEILEEKSSRYDSIYLHPRTSAAAELAVGSSVDLVTAVVQGQAYNGMGIIRPPGHHAMHNAPCGYSYYNNVAIAAKHALDNLGVQRVLVVDWDVHHGQATQQMFYDDPRLLYFSVHRYEHGEFWPELRESNFDFTGQGKAKGYNCNVPLNATGLGNDEYLSIWTNLLLPLAYEFSPDLVLVSGGYDSALGDEKGQMRVTPAFYCQLATLLMPLAAGKLVVLLEGGYCLESLAEGAALTLRTLLGDVCPNLVDPVKGVVHPCVSDTVLNCISALRSEWQCLQYQGSYCADGGDRSTRHSKHKHAPVVEYRGTPPPTKYPTRMRHAELAPDQRNEVNATLARLRAGTSLLVPPSRVVYVYDSAMEAHYCQTESSHPERPARTREIMKLLRQTGLLQRLTELQSRAATEAELTRVHSRELVSLIASTRSYSDQQLQSLQDRYTSIYLHSDTHSAALLAAGSLIQVVEEVAGGRASRGVAVIRPPGHHAEATEPNGFCVFNNVAVAASHALNHLGLDRILIVDWDIHHGNGIQHAFEENSRVLYISLHLYKNATFFPHSTDAAHDQIGRGAGLGYNVNIPWQKGGVGDAEYIAAFTQVVLPVAYQYNPQLVIVSAGFDAAVNDPVGGCEVSPECFGHMTTLLSGLAAGKLVLALEGGYNLISTSHAMGCCVASLLGDAPPPLGPLVPAPHAVHTLNSVLDVLAPHWSALAPYRVDLPGPSVFKKSRRTGTGKGPFASDSSTGELAARLSQLDMSDGQKNAGSSSSAARDAAEASCSSSAATGQPSSGGRAAAVVSEEALIAALAAAGEDDSALTIEQLISQQSEGFMVTPLTWCEHIEDGVGPVPEGGVVTTAPCLECGSTQENWCCLKCYQVGCGRFVEGHLLQHGTAASHPLALSFSDLTVWCYVCEQYVHNKAFVEAKKQAYRSKFNEEMPVPESWRD